MQSSHEAEGYFVRRWRVPDKSVRPRSTEGPTNVKGTQITIKGGYERVVSDHYVFNWDQWLSQSLHAMSGLWHPRMFSYRRRIVQARKYLRKHVSHDPLASLLTWNACFVKVIDEHVLSQYDLKMDSGRHQQHQVRPVSGTASGTASSKAGDSEMANLLAGGEYESRVALLRRIQRQHGFAGSIWISICRLALLYTQHGVASRVFR